MAARLQYAVDHDSFGPFVYDTQTKFICKVFAGPTAEKDAKAWCAGANEEMK